MQDAFVTASVKRFEILARQDLDVAAVEPRLFDLVETVRREAQSSRELILAVARGLETLAHEAEVPLPGDFDVVGQGASLRCAGVLRRAADLLRGPEKDLTPPGAGAREAGV
jgi:hypothetical protein